MDVKYDNGIFWELAESSFWTRKKKSNVKKVEVKKEKIEKLKDPKLMEEKQRLLNEMLKKYSDDFYTKTHKAVFTCEEADIHTIPLFKDKPHAFLKNLFLKSKKKKELYLVVADENTKTSLNTLSKKLKLKGLRFASDDLLVQTLLVERGAVTGLAVFPAKFANKDVLTEDGKNVILTSEEIAKIKKVHVVVDAKLKETEKRLIFHPLVNTASTSIKREDYLKFLNDLSLNSIVFFDFEKNEIVE